jgi:choline dehydrogenase-like flavoprotein
MIVESNIWSEKLELEADIVIVGSGAAGMTLAMEFLDTPFKVLLLEAGKRDFSDSDQDPYKGEVVSLSHHGPLESYRRRMVGGTTTVWGGRCSPFIDIDFKKRDYVKNSGWPINSEDMAPYYKRAHDYCDIGTYDYSVENSLKGNPKIIPDLDSDVIAQDEIWRFSLPTNFQDKYISCLEKAANIDLLINAACTNIDIDPETGAVVGLQVSSSPGKVYRVRGKRYIIAAGGLETTRLLLASNDIAPDGVGNSSGLLGKYYASHLTGNYGCIELTTRACPVSWKYTKTLDGVYYKQRLRVVDDVQESKKLLSTRVILSHPGFGDPRHGSGVLSGAYLVKRFLKGLTIFCW